MALVDYTAVRSVCTSIRRDAQSSPFAEQAIIEAGQAA